MSPHVLPLIFSTALFCSLLLPSAFALNSTNQTAQSPSLPPDAGDRPVSQSNARSAENGTLPTNTTTPLRTSDNITPTSTANTSTSDSPQTYSFAPTSPSSKASTILVIIVLLSAFLSMGILSIYIQQQCIVNAGNLNFGNDGSNPSLSSTIRQEHGLSSHFIGSLPTLQFSKEQGLTDADSMKARNLTSQCVVCLNAFEEGEKLCLLPRCGHCFHRNCIDMWFFSHTTCPLCRCRIGHKQKEDKNFNHSSTYNLPSPTLNDLV